MTLTVPWLKEAFLDPFLYTSEKICEDILNTTHRHLLSYRIVLGPKSCISGVEKVSCWMPKMEFQKKNRWRDY